MSMCQCRCVIVNVLTCQRGNVTVCQDVNMTMCQNQRDIQSRQRVKPLSSKNWIKIVNIIGTAILPVSLYCRDTVP